MHYNYLYQEIYNNIDIKVCLPIIERPKRKLIFECVIYDISYDLFLILCFSTISLRQMESFLGCSTSYLSWLQWSQRKYNVIAGI